MEKSLDWLIENIGVTNLCDRLGDDALGVLAAQAKTGYELDDESRTDWRQRTEEGIKIAKQITEEKTFPWPGAANVRYPLIATAAIQFAARAYPQIVNGKSVVKAEIIGKDPDGTKESRAKRISDHMSYQVLEQMPEWEPDMDQLLHGLPVMGTYFKKTFYDPLYQRNRSIALNPLEVVVNMKHKGDLSTCRRITQELWLYKNEVIERERAGQYREGSSSYMTGKTDDEKSQELFLEQHCWFDADGDGYEEPYIVTLHYDSGEICRVVANYETENIQTSPGMTKLLRITPGEYFTKFTFIPSPDGDFYDIGFAHLLGPINESMSTLINQLLDAGALANTGGGFISKGLRWQGGQLSFKLGEWKPVDAMGASIKDSIVPLPVREPSGTLFQLLGLLNDAGNKLASVSEVMSGETPSQNTPATTTLAVIEQGLKVFTAIYKRIFRSLKQEFKKLYRLNARFMDEAEYFRVLDEQVAVFKRDYAVEDLDIVPVADPTMAAESQKLARAQALMQTMQMNPTPEGKTEILLQYYDAIGAKNIDKLMPLEKIQQMNQNPPPNPETLKLQLETQIAKDAHDAKMRELEMQHQESVARLGEIEAKIKLLNAQAIKAIADAEAVEIGQQFKQYKAQVDSLVAAKDQQEGRYNDLQKQLADYANARAQQAEGQPPKVMPLDIKLQMENAKGGRRRAVKITRDEKGEIAGAELVDDDANEGAGTASELGPQPGALAALKQEVI